MRYPWLLAMILLTGCGLFGGRGRRGQTQPTNSAAHGPLEVTLQSRCPHPVEICYGAANTCVTVDAANPRAARGGHGELFVSLKGTDVTVFADHTFSVVEVDESCAHLYRQPTP